MATGSRSSSRLSLYSKLPPIDGASDEPFQNLQDVQQWLNDAREESSHLLQHLVDQTNLVQKRIEERLKASLEKTTKFIKENERSQEKSHGKEIDAIKDELKEAVRARDNLLKREQALVSQQTRMSIELAAESKARKQAEDLAQKLIKEHQAEKEAMQRNQFSEINLHRSKIEEEIKHIGNLKDQVSAHSAEIKRLREELKKEKATRQQVEDSKNADETKLSATNKKLTVDVSKLKAQIQTITESLATATQQKGQLERKIEQMQRNHADALKMNTSSHASTMKTLKDKVSSLEEELSEMRLKYQKEIDRLLAELHEAQRRTRDVDSDLILEDARIRQLRKMNKAEKKLLEEEKRHHKTVKIVN
eukprot:m.9295 g.9295  ORF g.9295 m.9295 type:complete len:363 (+) comp21246_c0_seq2:3-1091(+)